MYQGLVKSIGVSNFNSVQITDILDKGTIAPVTNQVKKKSKLFGLIIKCFLSLLLSSIKHVHE